MGIYIKINSWRERITTNGLTDTRNGLVLNLLSSNSENESQSEEGIELTYGGVCRRNAIREAVDEGKGKIDPLGVLVNEIAETVRPERVLTPRTSEWGRLDQEKGNIAVDLKALCTRNTREGRVS